MDDKLIVSLQEALQTSPGNNALRLLLGRALAINARWTEAEDCFKILLEADPDNVQAKTGWVKCLFETQRYSMAAVIIEELMQAGEIEPALMMMYARIHVEEKQLDKARLYYTKAVEADPSLSDHTLDALFRQGAGATSEEILSAIEEAAGDTFITVSRPIIDFRDVGGMGKVKKEIDFKIIQPLLHPEIYRAYGKKTGGGILLYGPPGCGKTHIAKATAGEVDAGFVNIGINDILDMWIGNSEKNLHEMFDIARRNKPCVLFIDEIDALGANRNDIRQSGGRALINQFLNELDGLEGNNEGILILGATNAPWHLDAAFRRPGRFDRIIFVGPPDESAREEIWRIILNDKPITKPDFKNFARQTEGFSGADIKAVLDIAIEAKLEEAFRLGVPTPLQTHDITMAAKKHKPTIKDWFSTARNYALYANESGIYDDVLEYLKIKK